MDQVCVRRPPLRGARLVRLATALDLLNHRIRLESQDVAVALALRARFGPALPSIRETQRTIAAQLARGGQTGAELERLQLALEGLAAAITFPLAVDETAATSRPAARRAQQRAARLSASAREMLGAIAKALAVGAAATALYASPATAACTSTGPTSAECTGDLSSGGLFYTAPPVDTLTVDSLTNDITPATGNWAVIIAGQGGNGTSGGAYTSGDPGTGGAGVTLTVSDPTHKIVTDAEAAVIFASTGGSGGAGGDSVGAGAAGSGGAGGNAGGANGQVSIDISTTGANAFGVLGVSAGGSGGNGGNFYVGGGAGGSGGAGGLGGPVNLKFGPNSLTTDGAGSHAIYAISLGGDGGTAGYCDVSVYCGPAAL